MKTNENSTIVVSLPKPVDFTIISSIMIEYPRIK